MSTWCSFANSLSCFFSCVAWFVDALKPRPQYLHLNGLAPVCVFICCLSASLKMNPLLHTLQTKTITCRCLTAKRACKRQEQHLLALEGTLAVWRVFSKFVVFQLFLQTEHHPTVFTLYIPNVGALVLLQLERRAEQFAARGAGHGRLFGLAHRRVG